MSQACSDVAQLILENCIANDKPSIRCAINDQLDVMSKDGFRVFHGYSQERAITKIRGIIKSKKLNS